MEPVTTAMMLKSAGIGLAANAANAGVGGVLGLLTRKMSDRQQLRQQEKLNAMALRDSKSLMDYQHGLSLKHWEETGPAAQRKQLEKAGLSMGLMYGMGGGTQGQSVQPSATIDAGGANGQNDMLQGMAVQLSMQKLASEIKLNESVANKNNTDAEFTGGVQTAETKERIEQIKATVKNVTAQALLVEAEIRLADQLLNFNSKTERDRVRAVELEDEIAAAELKALLADASIKEEEKKAAARFYLNRNLELAARAAAQNAGAALSEQEVKNLRAGIEKITAEVELLRANREFMEKNYDLRKREVDNIIKNADMEDSTKEYIRAGAQVVGDVIKVATRSFGSDKPKPVKGFSRR